MMKPNNIDNHIVIVCGGYLGLNTILELSKLKKFQLLKRIQYMMVLLEHLRYCHENNL